MVGWTLVSHDGLFLTAEDLLPGGIIIGCGSFRGFKIYFLRLIYFFDPFYKTVKEDFLVIIHS
jgi:hypothetical protein